MANNYNELIKIGDKEYKYVLGLMSGTSLDGLDLALCKVKGTGYETDLEIINFQTVEYEDKFRDEIRKVFAKPDACIQDVCFLDQLVATKHSQIINDTILEWQLSSDLIDIIASHGQTVYHAPGHFHENKAYGNITLQVGDGDFIAQNTGIITASDFRQKHIAAGGEGAPLALYGDVCLFSNQVTDRILLNIGGIANFTYLPKLEGISSDFPFSTDTGPGNTLMDAYMRYVFGKEFDRDAKVAESGVVNEQLLKSLMENPFFDLHFPKTTGPELFNLEYLFDKIQSSVNAIIPVDVMATLNRFSVLSITEGLEGYANPGTEIFISGGGAHNPLLMDQLKLRFPNSGFKNTKVLGVDGDAKEAVLFAVLANELLFGDPKSYPYFGENMPKTTMGKLSFP
ncbi:anhydro-N-acetylmuramic acid kinase [Membranihabitans maritimus]|uniref:anhydro-N-acetylmuramic acid kinase n=1 Tax=Membranihabitans maritimus TaxID=2904244 RepID=UPI001F372BAE|nr:anhydro-N-acetylmuramic acid kinase [Membranihabitans maritimus]